MTTSPPASQPQDLPHHLPPAPAAPAVFAEAPWKIVDQRTCYENPWTTVIEETLTGPDGQAGLYGYFAPIDCVVVVPLWWEGGQLHTALVEQWRQPIRRSTWEVPCGRIEAGEDILLAAARELGEECALSSDRWLALGQWQHSDARVAGTIYAFAALAVRPLSRQQAAHLPKDSSEIDLAAFRLPLSQALTAIDDGRLCQVASMSALLRAAAHPQVQALSATP